MHCPNPKLFYIKIYNIKKLSKQRNIFTGKNALLLKSIKVFYNEIVKFSSMRIRNCYTFTQKVKVF